MAESGKEHGSFHSVFDSYLKAGIGGSGLPWSDQSFGQTISKDARTISNYRRGSTRPPKVTFEAICRYGFKLIPPSSREDSEKLRKLYAAYVEAVEAVESPNISTSTMDPGPALLTSLVQDNRQFKLSLDKKWETSMYAPAIRMIGANGEYFSEEQIEIVVTDKEYQPPSRLIQRKAEILNKLRSNPKFFNGPHTRMLDLTWRYLDARKETRIPLMTFGPLWWEEFAVARDNTDELLASCAKNSESLMTLLELVPIEKIIEACSLSAVQTPCIVDTATTIVTADGWLGISVRSSQVQHFVGGATAAVAENIHQDFDHSLSTSENRRMPSPFRAALRGMEEEISPALRESFVAGLSKIVCSGVSFDLIGMHPDVLFLALLKETRFQVESSPPGKDFVEGRLVWVPLTSIRDTCAILSNYKWTGAGLASAIRCFEILQNVAAGGQSTSTPPQGEVRRKSENTPMTKEPNLAQAADKLRRLLPASNLR